MFNSRIIGLGHYVPENVVTNDDLSKLIDTSDSWIQERTGIKERRWIDPKSDDTTSTMAVKASKIAIKKSGLNKNDIDFIIFATLSPDMYFYFSYKIQAVSNCFYINFFSISLFNALYEYLSGFDETPKTKVFFTIL